MERKVRRFKLKSLMNDKARRWWGFFFAALLGLFFSFCLPVWSNNHSQSEQVRQALELAREGQQQYNSGQIEQAAELWQQAAKIYQQAGDREGTTKSLINQSQALQDLGLYPKACRTLLKAFERENSECNPQQLNSLLKTLAEKPDSLSPTQAIGLRGLGDVLRRRGMLPESKAALQLSQSVSKDAPLSASLLSLGNTERALANQKRDRWSYEQITEIIDAQSLQKSLEPYRSAFNAYRQAADIATAPALTKTQARLNHFSLLLDIEQWWHEQTNRRLASRSRLQQPQTSDPATIFLSNLSSELAKEQQTLLAQIKSDLSQLPSNRATVYTRINLAENLIRQGTDGAETGLKTALQEAQKLGDNRAETYALGYLGRYYAQQRQLLLATQLTQQALNLAQEIDLSGDAREVVYLWQSQLGKLLKQQKDRQGAIAAYSAAFNTLQSLRTDLNANERDIQFNFSQEVKPVYLDLVDLLLESDLSQEELDSLVLYSPDRNQMKERSPKNRLEIARRVIESLQLAELDNFFQDPCLAEADVTVQIDDLDPQAAVIYPIILPERLEVIVSLPKGVWRKATIPASDRQVNETLDELYDTLYNESIDNSAINIFRTIPLNPEEVDANLQQLLPIFTQVYDWLIRPFEKDFQAQQIQNLVFVLNDRFQRVPMAALYDGDRYLLEKYGIALVPSLQLFDLQQQARQKREVLAVGVSQQVQIAGEIFPALTNVPKELAQIQQAFPASQTLLDDRFTETAFQNLLKSNFSIVHLATHGLFSSNPEQTFIITGDRNTINIDRLRSLLTTDGAKAPELLVLSACETATGDERAVLGLAGVATRSGARSVLATLWAVGDASTTELMDRFYQALKEPQMKKLAALRNAQLELLKSSEVNATEQLPLHPYYWAPYVLVGNWL